MLPACMLALHTRLVAAGLLPRRIHKLIKINFSQKLIPLNDGPPGAPLKIHLAHELNSLDSIFSRISNDLHSILSSRKCPLHT